MTIQHQIRPDKFRTYRSRKRAAGLREVRVWVPDLTDPVVLADWRCEGEILRRHPSEKDATDFIEAAMADALKDED